MKEPKPFKTGTEFGIPVVKKIVSDEVFQVIKILHINQGSYIERMDIFNFGRLVIPGLHTSVIRIEQGFLIPILEWCRKQDCEIMHISRYELHPDTWKTIGVYNL
jgi:hypothetical protein